MVLGDGPAHDDGELSWVETALADTFLFGSICFILGSIIYFSGAQKEKSNESVQSASWHECNCGDAP